MQRAELLQHLRVLEAAGRAAGLRLIADPRPAASPQELAYCEKCLGIRIPDPYRETLLEWDGCDIRLVESVDSDGPKDALRAEFSILSSERIAVVTKSLRKAMEMLTVGSSDRDGSLSAMLRAMAITYHDDIAALLLSDPNNESDVRVRQIDLEYIRDPDAAQFTVIAESPDEYFEKCLKQLTKSLETEIFW